MRSIPNLETNNLVIRPFTMEDLAPAWRIINRCFGDGALALDPEAVDAYRPALRWMTLNTINLAQLYQPPYGDRAVVLKASGEVIGRVGYVPCIDRYSLIPSLTHYGVNPDHSQAEVGLFWAIDPDHQRRGYACEAARALIDYAFDPGGAWLGLSRIIATTEFDNTASQAVMRKLGMRVERNETGQPPWLQVVGVLNH